MEANKISLHFKIKNRYTIAKWCSEANGGQKQEQNKGIDDKEE